jgi:hypothetical protein
MSEFGGSEQSMESSWIVEFIHGSKFELWVFANMLAEKDNTCSMQGYTMKNYQNI